MRALVLFCCAAALAACGPPPMVAYHVTLTPASDCTLTGDANRSCVDEEELQATAVKGRWILENRAEQSFALTNEEGRTLVGIYFADDAVVLNEPPCTGQGGQCYFARRSESSTDADNNNCTRDLDIITILHELDGGDIEGITVDQTKSDENCGTSTITQRIVSVAGSPAEQLSLAREEDAQ